MRTVVFGLVLLVIAGTVLVDALTDVSVHAGGVLLALMLGGGLNALQNTVIVASLPFLIIIAGLAVSFWMELIADRRAGLTTRNAAAFLTTPLEGKNDV